MTPEIAFVALALFNQLRYPMIMIGLLINHTIQVLVSNQRIKNFLIAEEIDKNAIDFSSNYEGYSKIIKINEKVVL